MSTPITIGITDYKRYDDYVAWIKGSNVPVNIIRLSWKLDNGEDVHSCDGFLLTGGEDVQPALYGKPEYEQYLNSSGLNPARDEFEWKLLDNIFALKKPLLTTCRSTQLTNVYMGGTLIYDLPTVLNNQNHHRKDGIDQSHSILIEPNSLLHSIIKQDSIIVNSSHHQSVEMPGKGLKVVAYSREGIIEALELSDKTNNSWFLLLQWHPERMPDDLFATAIREAFLQEVLCHKQL